MERKKPPYLHCCSWNFLELNSTCSCVVQGWSITQRYHTPCYPLPSIISPMLLPNLCVSPFSFLLCLSPQFLSFKFFFISISESQKWPTFEIGSVNIIKLPLRVSFPQHFIIIMTGNYRFQFCRFLESLMLVSIWFRGFT